MKFRAMLVALLGLSMVAGCDPQGGQITVRPIAYKQVGPRISKQWASGWRFVRSRVAGGQAVDFDDSKWKKVTIPHCFNVKDGQAGGQKGFDWNRSDSDAAYYRGETWYRRQFSLTEADKNRRLFVKFEAACSVADVYINGKKLGQHKGAFTAFCYELTGKVYFDKPNVLAVKVSNAYREDVAPLSGDFVMFGGIYRPVHFIKTAKTCITPLDYASPGVYLTQKTVSKKQALVEMKAKISNGTQADSDYIVQTTVFDTEGKRVTSSLAKSKIVAGKTKPIINKITINNPHLWAGLDDPYMYTVRVEVFASGKIIDSVTQPLGLRWFKVDPEKGFFLNGKSYQIRGANRHQDRQDRGWALTQADHDEDMALALEIGLNGIRLAHYPQSQYFYNLCDANGILVWAELPLVDIVRNTPEFHENARQQLVEMIRQSYNCPSIFCWSLWNELMHRPSDNPVKLISNLHKLAKAEDPTRFTTCAANAAHSRAKGLMTIVDHPGFNKYPGWYGSGPDNMGNVIKGYNKSAGNKGISVAEYGAGASAFHQQDLPCRPKSTAYWHPEQWQSYVHERNYQHIKNSPAVWGSFIWNLIEFSSIWRAEGDHPGRNDKGLVTYDRKIRKDAFYFYKANWSKKPVLHLASKRFTVRPQAKTFLKAYSNCEKVQAFLNGKPLGEKTSKDHIFSWEITLNKGKNDVKVVGIRNGETFMDSATWEYDPAYAFPTRWIWASDDDHRNFVENTVDKNARSRWTAKKKGSWIRYMLEKDAKVSEISIDFYRGKGTIYSFEVQISDDGKTWKKVFAGKSSGKSEKAETYKFDAVSGNYLRLVLNGSNRSSQTSIQEVVIPGIKPKYYYRKKQTAK